MDNNRPTDDSPGSVLFPEYDALFDLIAAEVQGLNDVQLDFDSETWEWSRWSIRRQLSHMASVFYRWLLVRWGDILFPQGGHDINDIQGLAQSHSDRRMDDQRYWELPVVLDKLHGGIDLARRVLAERSVGFLRGHTYRFEQTAHWSLSIRAHPTGVTPADRPSHLNLTLEATMRHIYFEEITHLYNIQRLKRAQGLGTQVELPRVGYWILDGWDRSEPTF